MSHDPGIADLKQLLERIRNAAGDRDRVSLRVITEELGSRSFGPLLLLPGLVILAPIIGDIPGVPTLMAIIVLLVAGQLLIGRRQLWLPRWLLERSVERGKVDKALSWMRRPARFIDRFVRPRLCVFVNGFGVYAIAIMCVAIAAATPPMEFVPFTANGAGFALTAFGLALIARDGLVALVAFVFTATNLQGRAVQLSHASGRSARPQTRRAPPHCTAGTVKQRNAGHGLRGRLRTAPTQEQRRSGC